jgi:hypothetical protein
VLTGRPFTILPEEGLEPSLPCENGILNPARLPIPPLRRVVSVYLTVGCDNSCSRPRPAYAILPQCRLTSTASSRILTAWEDVVKHGSRAATVSSTSVESPVRCGYAMWNDCTSDSHRTYRRKHFKTVSVARKWVKQFNARMDLSAIGDIDRFTNRCRKESREATVAKYIRASRRFFHWCPKHRMTDCMTDCIPLDQATAGNTQRKRKPTSDPQYPGGLSDVHAFVTAPLFDE